MPSPKQRTVAVFRSSTAFLIYMLQNHAPPTTIIVCATREDFLHDLEMDHRHIEEENISNSSSAQARATKPESLLWPTIHHIATSTTINLAFVPTLIHLRAYLAIYNAPDRKYPTYEKPGTRVPFLALLNPLLLHHDTSDFSAQGLSRTMALAVEAASRGDMRLLVAEVATKIDTAGDVEEERGPLRDPWRAQVPLLSGSVRFGGDERVWAGRTIEVRQVMERWCNFVDLEPDDERT